MPQKSTNAGTKTCCQTLGGRKDNERREQEDATGNPSSDQETNRRIVLSKVHRMECKRTTPIFIIPIRAEFTTAAINTRAAIAGALALETLVQQEREIRKWIFPSLG